MKKIILTGGGTAGHVMPNIALLPHLSGCEVHYIGGSGMEKELLAPYKSVTYHEIPCVKFIRGFNLKNLLIPFKLIKSVTCAKKIIGAIHPDVIFTKGGYVSLPVALAAGKVPLVTHESDITLGLTNRLISRKCRYVCTSFDVTARGLKNGVHTGALLRKELYCGKRHTPYPTLLIMGGSLGSEAINNCVKDALGELTKRYNVVHITGKNSNMGDDFPRYKSIKFADMPDVYAGADLIVSRGGANSLFEIAALGKKALIIPLPKGASRGDQEQNAAYFSDHGITKTLPQSELTPSRLLKELTALETFSPKKISADGTSHLAHLLLSI